MKAFYTLFLLVIVATFSNAQCDSSSMQLIQVRASDTDPNISWELARHHVFINEDCNPQNKLLVHMVGSYDNPTSTLKFPAIAANNGFHVVSLRYPNSVAAQTACAGNSDSTCYLKFRKEILEGIDYSTEVDVDTIDCVYNRLIKLLKYLDTNYPSQNWGQFYSGDEVT